MSQSENSEVVKVGDYIIIQRQSYMKLHKVNANATVMLGKDQLKISAIIGKPLWTTYKMEPRKASSRDFVLTECDSAESLAEQLANTVSSGIDNRNIFDDGNSQQLSTEDIIGMRDSGMSGQAIVGQLIENSKTFSNKTEYSQEKYLKKKEKKYFEYITIRRPTIRLIAQIMYRQDPTKSLREDTLAQLTTAVGMTSQGTYILYENGFQGLVAATMLSYLDEGGSLVHIHAGNIPQKQAILAMNFSSTHMSRLISVNIYSLLRKLLKENENEGEGVVNKDTIPVFENEAHGNSITEHMSLGKDTCETKPDLVNSNTIGNTDVKSAENQMVENMEEDTSEVVVEGKDNRKRKYPNEDESGPKKLRWEMETERAAEMLKAHPADGLVVVTREHPENIVSALLPFVAPSRPFVVFSICREPLLELYTYLKSRNDVIALRLTESWFRTYQILPNRTHPSISMSGGGGYLLSGIVVKGSCDSSHTTV